MNLRLVANDRKFQYVTAISGDFSNAKEMRLYHMQEWIGSKAEVRTSTILSVIFVKIRICTRLANTDFLFSEFERKA